MGQIGVSVIIIIKSMNNWVSTSKVQVIEILYVFSPFYFIRFVLTKWTMGAFILDSFEKNNLFFFLKKFIL
jgi:hypothetical protein